MKIQDLGDLNGPILVFGGVYSNLQALNALLKIAKTKDIPSSNIICTGDVVAYCANPVQVWRRVYDAKISVLAGNCEKQLAENALNCGCGFEENSECNLLSYSWYDYANKTVTERMRYEMAYCPDRIVFSHKGKRYGVIHGGVFNISQFHWPNVENEILLEEISQLEIEIGAIDYVLAGHSGLSFIRDLYGKKWVNAGVIGMPENDGLAATRYAIIDKDINIHHLTYDVENAVLAMRKAGLTQGYDRALKTGYWPSQDNLSTSLRV